MTNVTKSRWEKLAYKLCAIYKDEQICEGIAKKDIEYLQDAYLFTEKLWYSQFEKLPNKAPVVVMLSEAPLFGAKKNYFYNPDTAPSAFFWLNDARAVAGDDVAFDKQFECAKEKKQFLIDIVTRSGLLILDLFPYALNEKDTALNYRKIRTDLYLKIFSESCCDHLAEKLDLIKDKCKGSNPTFLFRYKRLKDRLEEKLCSNELVTNNKKIDSVNGENMSLNRSHLKEIFDRHR